MAVIPLGHDGGMIESGSAVLVAGSQRVRGWLDAFDARIAVRAAHLAGRGECESAGSVLAGRGCRSQRDAEAAASRAGVCDTMASVHDALSNGTISAGHVDAVANAAASLDDTGRAALAGLEDDLVKAATAMPVETFERECQSLARILAGDNGAGRHERHRRARRVRRWVDRQTGMCKTLIELDAETDATMWAAINAAIAAARAAKQDADLTFDQLEADALVGLITGARTGDQRVAEISVLIDLATLRDGLHDRSVCETSDGRHLGVETIRRMCCDGDIVPVVLGGHGEVLDVGRSERLANRAQRRALRAMYRTCAHPECHVTFEHCRIHHVVAWEHGGPTNLDHLIPLCAKHHHLVHEGGWALTLTPERIITLGRPDGTVYFTGSTVDRTEHLKHTEPPPRTDDETADNSSDQPIDHVPATPVVAEPAPGDTARSDESEIPDVTEAAGADVAEAACGYDDEPVGAPAWILDLVESSVERPHEHLADHSPDRPVNFQTLTPDACAGRSPP